MTKLLVVALVAAVSGLIASIAVNQITRYQSPRSLTFSCTRDRQGFYVTIQRGDLGEASYVCRAEEGWISADPVSK